MADVLTSVSDGLARLTLNRPQALHALTRHMCANMIQSLLIWQDDPAVQGVVIAHAPGTRGFCAGGDIRKVAESGAGDGVAARDFFFTEYRLNHLLFDYPKPVIALMDGVTMGGGVGLALPARFRIATENTLLAMPEAGIGLFPDVGAGWHLSRLPGQIGMWLALTGARLKAADCLLAGLATHYVESAKLPALMQALASAAAGGDAALAEAIGRFASDPGAPAVLTGDARVQIERIFAGGSVEAIMAALAEDASPWAQAQLETLRTKSPQTLKVAFRQIRDGVRMPSFADEMRQEYRLAARIAQRPDFIEGVRAVLIDKDNAPRWDPPNLSGVTPELLDSLFAPLPPEQEWTPL